MTILLTIGATKKAVGKAIKKPKKNDFAQIKKKCGANPKLIKTISPDIIKAIINAIKKGNNILGVLSFIFFNCTSKDCFFRQLECRVNPTLTSNFFVILFFLLLEYPLVNCEGQKIKYLEFFCKSELHDSPIIFAFLNLFASTSSKITCSQIFLKNLILEVPLSR